MANALHRIATRYGRSTGAALLVLAAGCSGPSDSESSAVGEQTLALYPSPECIPPLPEGPIWLAAQQLEPLLFIELVPGLHHIIQFRQAPSAEDLVELSALGIELLEPVPEKAFWARVHRTIDAPAALPMAGGIARAFPASTELKVHPSLVKQTKGGRHTVAVHWFSDASVKARASTGPELKVERRFGNVDIVTGALPNLKRLASFDDVQFVEPYTLEVKTHSHAGEIAHNASALYLPPHEITGSGRSVAVFDNGWADFDHPDLAGRVFHDPSLLSFRGTPIAGSTLDSKGDHATAMTGIIASSGAGNPAARGTVPAVDVYSYLFVSEYLDPDELVATESELHGWRVANHSYGNGWPCGPPSSEPCKSDSRWTSYLPEARSADIWATEGGVLSVYSGGNDGLVKESSYPAYLHDNWQTIHSAGVAKNAISVCAANPTLGRTIEFGVKLDSSKGPASDGRVKPDLCALGDRLPSEPTMTTQLGGGYRETYATSPAAAEVSGAAVALHEQYARMFPDSDSMPPALAKGLLIHTARDMTDTNTARWNGRLGVHETAHTAVGPDYTTGWGFMDLGAAFNALVNFAWRANTVAAGRQNDFTIRSVAPGAEVRVTLIWDDPPGSAGISRTLINDLDLRVTNLATGEVTFPFVLIPLDPSFPAGRGVNFRDNVEQVRFEHTGDEPADFLVEVVATSLALRAQRYYLISEFPLAPPVAVIDEHWLRGIVEANELARLSCMGLLLSGPRITLSRRLIVTLDDTLTLETPFMSLGATEDLYLAPMGVAGPGAVEQWSKLHEQLKQTSGGVIVLSQERRPKLGGDLPIGAQFRRFAKATDRLDLALDALKF